MSPSPPKLTSPAPAALKIRALAGLREKLGSSLGFRTEAALDRLPVGIVSIDALFDGGIPQGALSEIVCAVPSSGGQLLLQALLQAAAQARRFTALVDGRDAFDPQTASSDLLSHLLWVRCQTAAQSLQALECLARDGNLPLLFADLRDNPEPELRRLPSAAWYRLQRIAEQSGAALVMFTPRPLVASTCTRLRLTRPFSLADLFELRSRLWTELKADRLRSRFNSEEDLVRAG